MSINSVVYFIEARGRIKIGFTKNLKSRMSSINTSSPDRVTVLATVPGGRELERIIHDKLAEFRQQGEWFLDNDHVRCLMAELVSGNPDAFIPEPVPAKIEEPAPEPSDGFDSVSERFLTLCKHPFLEAFQQARLTEHKLSIKRGAIVSSFAGGDSPVDSVMNAYRVLDVNLGRFGDILDDLLLSTFHRDSSEIPLIRAAEILIDETEAAFAEIQITTPELGMPFLVRTHAQEMCA